MAVLGSAAPHDGDPKLLDKQPAYAGPGWRNAQRLRANASAALAPGGAGSGGASTGLASSGPAIAFTSSNVTLLSWVTLEELGVPSTGNGNSCYGYTSPSGREYALMGTSAATAFVEITQPGDPVIVTQVPGPTSLWRDMRTYSHYAYAVTEGGGGIQVMDLASIDAGVVTVVGTVHDDLIGSTHTLTIDQASGYLYRSGGSGQGLRIYDVHTNPAVPTRVGAWSDRYVHEATIVPYTSGPAAGKEIAYCCGGLATGYTQTGLYVVDVTNKASPTLLRYVTYPNATYAHQCWPSSDLHWLYLDDELDDSELGVTCLTRVFDISDPANTFLSTAFTNFSSSIDHNQYVRGDLVFQSNYRSGLRVQQTSGAGTPTHPVEVAWFDTWPEDDQAHFNSLWNNYPYFPSGVVIGSDLEKGLFVWWVGAPQVAFAPASGSPDTVSAAGDVLRVQISGPILPGSARIHWDAGSGPTTASLVQAANGDWLATLPPIACGTDVRYSFSAQSPNGVVWSDPPGAPDVEHSAHAAWSRTTLYADDFESAQPGWIASPPGDTATSGLWTRVDPVGTDLAPENDHTPLGTTCWVTGQGAPGGAVNLADVDGGITRLVSPQLALAGNRSARVAYWRWYDDQVPNGGPPDDPFVADVSSDDGATWTRVETLGPIGHDARGGWMRHEFRVADFVVPTNQVRVRFVAQDLNNDTHVEAAVDDFCVLVDQCGGYASFCSGDGSALACPCGNAGASGAGCANSTGSGGLLDASGLASIASDGLVLAASGMPANATAVYLQGDVEAAGGLGLPFGDGLRCVAGNLVRLGTRASVGGSSQYPLPGDPSISVRGGAAPGDTRCYQVWYRNAASFCTGATDNGSNGIAATWSP